MTTAARYAIGDLAQLGGVSRRTVRYYVQEGLISPPHGVGRGNHYGPEHLEQLLRVKAMQEAGRTLDEIRRASAPRVPSTRERAPGADAISVSRSVWRRLTLAPGIELHVAGDVRLPMPSRIEELASWCRRHFGTETHAKSEDDHD